jgi:hypothetical protein
MSKIKPKWQILKKICGYMMWSLMKIVLVVSAVSALLFYFINLLLRHWTAAIFMNAEFKRSWKEAAVACSIHLEWLAENVVSLTQDSRSPAEIRTEYLRNICQKLNHCANLLRPALIFADGGTDIVNMASLIRRYLINLRVLSSS